MIYSRLRGIPQNTVLMFVLFVPLLLSSTAHVAFAQKVGYVATQAVRDRFYEYKNAQQRIEEIANGWKREMDDMQSGIVTLEQEIQKKRLIWTDAEAREKDSLLLKKKRDRDEFTRRKFNAGGEFDSVATNYLRQVETKIAAAVQDVAAADNFDIILDKATSPLLVASPRFDITVKVLEKLNIFADDLKAKQKDAIEREDKQKQEQKRTTPTRRRGSSAAAEEKKAEEKKTDEKKTEEKKPDEKKN